MKSTTRNFLLGLSSGCVITVAVIGLLIFGLGAWTLFRMRNLDLGDLDAGLRPPPVPTLTEPLDFDWHLHSLDGERFELDRLRGKPLILNFWATWCGPCIREIPALEQLAKSFSDDQVAVLLLSEEPLSTLQSFVEDKNIAVQVIRVAETPDDISFPSPIPTTWIVDTSGHIVFRHVGAANWADESVVRYLEELFETRSAEPPAR